MHIFKNKYPHFSLSAPTSSSAVLLTNNYIELIKRKMMAIYVLFFNLYFQQGQVYSRDRRVIEMVAAAEEAVVLESAYAVLNKATVVGYCTHTHKICKTFKQQ